MYEKDESLRLNDVVDFVGIKSDLPELAALQLHGQGDAADLDLMEEELAARPPTSLVHQLQILNTAKMRGAICKMQSGSVRGR